MIPNSLEVYQEKYVEKQSLGSGRYGFVYLVHPKNNPEIQLVCKKVRLGGLNDKDLKLQRQEVSLLRMFKHPHVVTVVDDFCDEDNIYLVMEYCLGGDLQQMIQARKKHQQRGFPQQVINRWLAQLLMALLYVHQRNVIHRDLKPSNLFLTKEGQIKLGDFGIARLLNQQVDKAKTIIGSPFFMAPEVCSGSTYTQSADIWSLGAIIVELCTLEHAFRGNKLTEIIDNIVNRKIYRQQDLQSYDPEFVELINLMLTLDPVERPSAKDLLGNPFVIKSIQAMFSPPPKQQMTPLKPPANAKVKETPPKEEPRRQSSVERRRERVKQKMNEYYKQVRQELEEVKQSHQKQAPTRVLDKIRDFLQETQHPNATSQDMEQNNETSNSDVNSQTIKSEFMASEQCDRDQGLFELSAEEFSFQQKNMESVCFDLTNESQIQEDIQCEDIDAPRDEAIEELYELSDSEVM